MPPVCLCSSWEENGSGSIFSAFSAATVEDAVLDLTQVEASLHGRRCGPRQLFAHSSVHSVCSAAGPSRACLTLLCRPQAPGDKGLLQHSSTFTSKTQAPLQVGALGATPTTHCACPCVPAGIASSVQILALLERAYAPNRFQSCARLFVACRQRPARTVANPLTLRGLRLYSSQQPPRLARQTAVAAAPPLSPRSSHPCPHPPPSLPQTSSTPGLQQAFRHQQSTCRASHCARPSTHSHSSIPSPLSRRQCASRTSCRQSSPASHQTHTTRWSRLQRPTASSRCQGS